MQRIFMFTRRVEGWSFAINKVLELEVRPMALILHHAAIFLPIDIVIRIQITYSNL